jgi:hypothetical protein
MLRPLTHIYITVLNYEVGGANVTENASCPGLLPIVYLYTVLYLDSAISMAIPPPPPPNQAEQNVRRLLGSQAMLKRNSFNLNRSRHITNYQLIE